MNDLYSNIITPPDFSTDTFNSVVLIDPSWDEVNTLAIFLKTADTSYNVYVYQSEMNDVQWLQSVASKVGVTIVANTSVNELSAIKDKLIVQYNAYYYGPKNFLLNHNRIEKLMDYFILEATKTAYRPLSPEFGQI